MRSTYMTVFECPSEINFFQNCTGIQKTLVNQDASFCIYENLICNDLCQEGMHPSAAKAYERAEKPRVRMHPSPAKAYERAKNLGFVCIPAQQKHTNEPKNLGFVCIPAQQKHTNEPKNNRKNREGLTGSMGRGCYCNEYCEWYINL